MSSPTEAEQRQEDDLVPLKIGGPTYNRKYTKEKLKSLTAKIEKETPIYEDFKIRNDQPSVIFLTEDHETALRYAIHAPAAIDALHQPCILMYTDGSAKGRFAGFSVTHKRFSMSDTETNNNQWIDAVYGLHGVSESQFAETLAVNRALWNAYYEILHWTEHNQGVVHDKHHIAPRVIIISDNAGAIQYFQRCYKNIKAKSGLANEFKDKALDPLQLLLRMGGNIELRWTPGHVDVEGNCRADRLATIGTYYARRISVTEKFDVERAILPFVAFSKTEGPRKISPFLISCTGSERRQDTFFKGYYN
ncbi:uncharacterized protein F4822DRAFT_432638 [Hypoxylon trugodes]|uniref:uncharacterized protein n=1 Tax=Hypoxylon trugodes TaxID=326681 RepID=UPI00218FEC4C|nr:uncharacterized protein F4822DRAFT_432638 [Hypoxylon trugodes]KAI1385780.1 hypothetical protein F4822DRAFT_432638 [Hypoxylon trugodes]